MKFSIGQVVGAALTSFEMQWKRLIAAVLLTAVVALAYVLGVVLLSYVAKKSILLAICTLVSLAYAPLFCLGVHLGWIAFVFAVAQGKRPDYGVLWSQLFVVRPLYALGMFFLAALVVLGGFILFIIPGMIALSRYYLASFPIIERGAGSLESLSESNRLVRGATGRVLLLAFIAGLFSPLPLIGPAIAELIRAHLYLRLRSEEGTTKKDRAS